MRTLVVGMAYTVHTVHVGDFPVPYQRVRDVPIATSVGGSGFTVARTLAGYGNEVYLAAPLGEDAAAATVDAAAYRYGVNSAMSPRTLTRSPRAVVLEDRHGRRQVNRDVGDAPTTYVELDLGALATSDLLVVDGVLPADALITGARAVGVPVAVGLGRTGGPPGLEQQPYLAADLICMRLAPDVDELALLSAWRHRSTARLVVVTLGARGAIGAALDSPDVIHVPARDLGPGAPPPGLGATYFATLAHFIFARGCAPPAAMEYAAAAAAWTVAHAEPDGLREAVVVEAAAAVPGSAAAGTAAPTDGLAQAP